MRAGATFLRLPTRHAPATFWLLVRLCRRWGISLIAIDARHALAKESPQGAWGCRVIGAQQERVARAQQKSSMGVSREWQPALFLYPASFCRAPRCSFRWMGSSRHVTARSRRYAAFPPRLYRECSWSRWSPSSRAEPESICAHAPVASSRSPDRLRCEARPGSPSTLSKESRIIRERSQPRHGLRFCYTQEAIGVIHRCSPMLLRRRTPRLRAGRKSKSRSDGREKRWR